MGRNMEKVPSPPSAVRPAESRADLGAATPRAVSEASLSAHQASEKERILTALSSCNWNRVKAAEIVGIPRRTFYRRLAKYGIQ